MISFGNISKYWLKQLVLAVSEMLALAVFAVPVPASVGSVNSASAKC